MATSLRQSQKRVEMKYQKIHFYRHRDFVSTCLRECFKYHGIQLEDRTVTDYCDAQRNAVIRHLQPRHDMFHMLETLTQRLEAMAIVSNIDNDHLGPLVNRWRLNEYMRFCLSSESAQSCKPDSAIFNQALKMLGVNVSSCLFVGDSEQYDILGASVIGMKTIRFFDGLSNKTCTCADYQIKTLSELIPIVDDLQQ